MYFCRDLREDLDQLKQLYDEEKSDNESTIEELQVNYYRMFAFAMNMCFTVLTNCLYGYAMTSFKRM